LECLDLSLLFANGHLRFAASTAETAAAVSGAIPSRNCTSFERIATTY
jgi:hypothetical protein